MLIEPKSVSDFIAAELALWQSLEPNINIEQDSMVYMDAAVMAELAYMLQQDAITLANQSFLSYATGDELSNLGADRGVNRKNSTRAVGVLELGRGSLVAADYFIPSGTKVSTQVAGDGTSVLFETTQDATLYGLLSKVVNVSGQQNTTGVLHHSTQYYYKVTAIDGNGLETDPSDPFGLLTTAGSDNKSVDLTWSASLRAKSYNIYVASGVSSQNNVQFLANTISPFYTDTLGSAVSSVTPPATNNTGALLVDVPGQALIPNSKGNVGASTIVQLISRPIGIEYVTNPSSFNGGADPEDDDTYRARIRNDLATNTGLTTVGGMKRIAKDVDGVNSATVYLPYPSGQRNEIWIFVTPVGGGLASDALISSVQAAFDDENNRAPVDNITVKKPSVHAIDVTAHIVEYEPLASSAAVLADVITQVTTFLANVEVGSKIRAVDIENVIHDTTGVKDFTMTIPSGNIQLADTEMAIPGNLNIT